MRTFLLLIGMVAALLGVVVLSTVQTAFGGVWLLLPLPSVIVFFTLLRSNLIRGIGAAIVVGLALDINYPFPFGTFLFSFLASVFATWLLFRTIFAKEMSIATIVGVGFGSFFSDILAWLTMHVFFFLNTQGEVLTFDSTLMKLILLRVVAAGILAAVLISLNNIFFHRFMTGSTAKDRAHASRF